MVRVLLPLALLLIAFWVYSIVDCALQPPTRHRGVSKPVWLLIVVLIPVLGGILCGVIFAVIIQLLMDGPISLALLIPLAAVLVLVGIAGDLTESMIKRASGVKDSGTILAGHGGLLDRIDSLLLSAPALYYLLYFLGIS